MAESESRSTLGMELSSPRYQDCEERQREGWRVRGREKEREREISQMSIIVFQQHANKFLLPNILNDQHHCSTYCH